MASINRMVAADVGEALLAAPFEEEGWTAALRILASFTGSSHGELIGIGSTGSVDFNWTTDADPEFFSDFIELNGGNPDANWRVACTSAPFEVMSEDDYAAVRRKNPRRYEAYDEFAHRYDMTNGCQTVLLNEQSAFVGLAVLRSHADGATTAEHREAFASVAPYVLSATRLQRSLEEQGAALMAGALDQVKAAAIICNGRGQVCGLTAGAEDWLGRTSRMVVRDGRLLCARSSENRRLNEAIKRGLAADTAPGVMDRFWLQGAIEHIDSDICEVFALPRRSWSFGVEPRILITIRSPTMFAGEGWELLKDMWDLSSAECAVAILLSQGFSRERIASSRSTSPVTVKTQLKSLFRKCGVNREAELVALLRNVLC